MSMDIYEARNTVRVARFAREIRMAANSRNLKVGNWARMDTDELSMAALVDGLGSERGVVAFLRWPENAKAVAAMLGPGWVVEVEPGGKRGQHRGAGYSNAMIQVKRGGA
jgi:hypothetical protein